MQTLPSSVPTKKIQKVKRGRKAKKSVQSSDSTIDDFEVKNSENIEIEESSEQASIYKGVKLPKYLRSPDEYQFLEVPVIVPTIQELQQPFLLVRRLHKEGYMKHGVVKIRPDKKTWNPDFVFDTQKKLMTTRIQNINDLTKAKAFEQNVDEYTYESFKKQSIDFDNEYKYQTNVGIQDFYRKNEYEYFSTIDNPDRFKDIEIEYAADLPSTKFGSAFAEQQKLSKNEQAWALKNINKQKNSLFQFVENNKQKCELSGITSPWVYLGMKFATFCFHTEDLWMYALNYLHSGEAKTWYTVPPQFKEKFEEVYKAKYHNIFKQKPDILHRLNLQLNPVEALKAYVPMYRTEQMPGEFIMTFPKVYHGGFSHGFNCGEAVNIATSEWFKYYREAVEDYALKGHLKKVSFPIEWMLTQIINDLHQCDFDFEELSKIRDEWVNIVKREIQQRYIVLETYKEKLMIHEFDNKNVKYDRMVCKNCQSYMFFSYLYCNKCLKSSCISHISTCFCINSKVSLFVRYTDNELHAFTQVLDDHLKILQQKEKK